MFRNLFESPVGMPGRTGSADADAHVTPELRAEFKKIVKQLGGKTVAKKLLAEMNAGSPVTEGRFESTDREENMFRELLNESDTKISDLDGDELLAAVSPYMEDAFGKSKVGWTGDVPTVKGKNKSGETFEFSFTFIDDTRHRNAISVVIGADIGEGYELYQPKEPMKIIDDDTPISIMGKYSKKLKRYYYDEAAKSTDLSYFLDDFGFESIS